MQHACRLVRPGVHRHGCAQVIRSDFRIADPQVLGKGLARAFLQLLECHDGLPDAHTGSLAEEAGGQNRTRPSSRVLGRGSDAAALTGV
jgi:hypothetical protein